MNRPFLNIESSGAILFDGLAAVCWFVNLRSDVANARVRNISPGQLYTFVITQDATGGHRFAWPSSCVNATTIDPKPNAITVQNFIGLPSDFMTANIAGTWSTP